MTCSIGSSQPFELFQTELLLIQSLLQLDEPCLEGGMIAQDFESFYRPYSSSPTFTTVCNTHHSLEH